ncbi:C-type mannose receptor 2-like [Polyodon spathula]|uniref:C-type mannose receptor 2-like n=1 Tax=Polyodon spathula TaxID=7913 RepID=UPI001B7E5D3C|nr:C-type mannose receptor 2-like [Polyodon spathula]
MTWSEAQSYCRQKHTDLATVRSQEEAEQLFNVRGDSFNGAAWIGLHRDKENWQWSNSDDVTYNNWPVGLYCAAVNSYGVWYDSSCFHHKNFMCYTETLVEELKNWTEAQQYCREHHTDLVSIKSASENEDLVKKAQGKPFWIGLYNNLWKWSHLGDNYTFHRFQIQEHLSRKFPMEGVNMRWRKIDGEIFHKIQEEEEEEEEEEGKCSEP